ncbi:MAG: SDR family oxidoreductase, partial [Victivallales bacterium]|nr:SDR family oxidoreductase [Victivallales bacterium]
MTIEPDIKGKNAVITGGSKGIGLAVAKELLLRDANVIVIARSFPENVKTELMHTGSGKCGFISTDLSRPEERKGLIGRAADWFGGSIDILFNNAGGVTDGSITDISEEEYIRSRELLFDSAV